MTTLAEFLELQTWIILLGFTAAVFFQLVSGRVKTAGVLLDKQTQRMSPERVQALVVTLGVAGFILAETMVQDAPGFPDIPDALVLLLFGSQSTYLAMKGGLAWARRH